MSSSTSTTSTKNNAASTTSNTSSNKNRVELKLIAGDIGADKSKKFHVGRFTGLHVEKV
jgi:hypothetical protein